MNYAKRLLAAKLMVIGAYVALIVGQANIAFEAYAPTLYFVMGCGTFILALILLWSKLHGTGRSVRMAAYHGLLLIIAPIAAISFLAGNTPKEYDSIALIQPQALMGLSFALFCIAMIISIKRS